MDVSNGKPGKHGDGHREVLHLVPEARGAIGVEKCPSRSHERRKALSVNKANVSEPGLLLRRPGINIIIPVRFTWQNSPGMCCITDNGQQPKVVFGGIQTNHVKKEDSTMTVLVTKNVGMLLLAVWLILTGLFSMFNISFEGFGVLMAILAIAAGVLILLGR